METVLTCPLGHICEEARDGKVYRCHWYVSTYRVDQQGQKVPESEQDICAISSLPLHLTELKKASRGVQGSVESFRNEVSSRQDQLTAPTYKRITG